MGELISIVEATRRVGVSKATMLRRLKSVGITRYVNARDHRERLVDWEEIQQLFENKPEQRDGY